MRQRTIYLLFAVALSTVIFTNYSGGAGANGAGDRTGSPISTGNCSTCHAGGSFAPVIAAQLLKDGNAVTQYVPGAAYTLRVTINATGTPNGYGFQAVALRGTDHLNAGAWNRDSLPAGFRVSTINNRQYAEHSSKSTGNVMEIKWLAPVAGSGSVRFYASGNAVNDNGSSSGDAAASLAMALMINEQTTSGAFDVALLPATINAYPNPVAEQLNLKIKMQESGRYQLSVFDLNGKELQRETVQLQNGENQEVLNVSQLAAGHYAVRLSDGKRVATQQIVKQ